MRKITQEYLESIVKRESKSITPLGLSKGELYEQQCFLETKFGNSVHGVAQAIVGDAHHANAGFQIARAAAYAKLAELESYRLAVAAHGLAQLNAPAEIKPVFAIIGGKNGPVCRVDFNEAPHAACGGKPANPKNINTFSLKFSADGCGYELTRDDGVCATLKTETVLANGDRALERADKRIANDAAADESTPNYDGNLNAVSTQKSSQTPLSGFEPRDLVLIGFLGNDDADGAPSFLSQHLDGLTSDASKAIKYSRNYALKLITGLVGAQLFNTDGTIDITSLPEKKLTTQSATSFPPNKSNFVIIGHINDDSSFSYWRDSVLGTTPNKSEAHVHERSVALMMAQGFANVFLFPAWPLDSAADSLLNRNA